MNRVEISDEGEYICTAINLLGNESASANVIIQSEWSAIGCHIIFFEIEIGISIIITILKQSIGKKTLGICTSGPEYRRESGSQVLLAWNWGLNGV